MGDRQKTDFFINQRPVSITLTCPHCGIEVTIPWNEVPVPDYWGDDWGTVSCPDCKKEIELGDYDI